MTASLLALALSASLAAAQEAPGTEPRPDAPTPVVDTRIAGSFGAPEAGLAPLGVDADPAEIRARAAAMAALAPATSPRQPAPSPGRIARALRRLGQSPVAPALLPAVLAVMALGLGLGWTGRKGAGPATGGPLSPRGLEAARTLVRTGVVPGEAARRSGVARDALALAERVAGTARSAAPVARVAPAPTAPAPFRDGRVTYGRRLG